MTQIDQPLLQSSPDYLARGDESSEGDGRGINVGANERLISVAGGAALALLGLSRQSLPGVLLAAVGGGLMYRGATGHCDVYAALGIDSAHREGGAEPEDFFQHGIHVEQAYTINKTPWELYDFWHNFENLPRIMSHLQSVRVLDEKRSHWVACGPAGYTVEWDAEIINDEPNALIAWRSLEGSDVDHAGSVRFVPAPGDRGTEVKVVIDYIPPAGRLGSWVAKLFGEEPQQQIQEDLRKFKRIMETGEFVTTKGQPRGSCSGSGYREE